MSNPADAFKINLNQNLWGVVVAFGALGLSELYNLKVLFWFSVVTSVVMTASILVTTFVYTYKYCKGKLGD